MATKSISFTDDQKGSSADIMEAQSEKAHDASSRYPNNITAPEPAVLPRTNSNVEPLALPRRTGTQTFLGQAKRILRGLRHHPVDPALKGVSKDNYKSARPRAGPAPCASGDVLEKVLPKKHCSIKYPEFDAAQSYVTTSEVLDELLRMETNRLMKVAKSPNDPLEFCSNDFFDGDTEQGYRDISTLCQKILTASAICSLDNECLNVKHCQQLFNRDRLVGLIKSLSMAQGATESAEIIDDLGAQKRNEQVQAMFSLLDYISAVLTRLIVQTSPGSYWQTNVLGVLIRRITKIKVLLLNIATNSVIALRAAETTLLNARAADPSHVARGDMNEEEECEEFLRVIEAKEKEGTASVEDREIATHCVEQNKCRFGLSLALRNILVSMRFINRSGLPATSFEICAVAYETGFEGFKALLFQDRDLEYSATSDLDNMNTAHTAFNILNQTARAIHSRRSRSKSKNVPESLRTTLQWVYCGSENNQCGPDDGDLQDPSESLHLESMDDVISVMVSLATTCPVFLANFTEFRRMMAMSGFIQDDVNPLEEGKFRAFFRLYTNQFKEKQDVLHLSQAMSSGYFSRSSLVRGSDTGPKEQQSAVHQLDELTKYMDEWVVDETCVTVPCPEYVWTVMSIATILAAGGLGIGFSVGDRINGVDPSNLATYLWVVAAFVVLVGKSLKVNEWSWNDFLRRRVRCRSVSELQSVSRIDAQLIIAKLIHDEQRGSVLKIRGPYNSAFRKRSTEGFSIDKPISSSTLLLSGMTMLKVVTAKGDALVCLDFRRGTDLGVIAHNPDAKKEYLICEQINRPRHGVNTTRGKAQFSVKHAISRSLDVKWKRVQGIYDLMDAWFV